MTDVPAERQRFLASGDEAGTAPEDRAFRPDVEGLRAVAVALVIAHHFRFLWFGGGYVGVDVFFVISGFVITGLLLRERMDTGSTSFVHFYARRCRRILPMALFVSVATVLATYPLLGRQFGVDTADDARWAAVFVYNVHYVSRGAAPISLLSSFWSLAVEEQFYLAFPLIFAVFAVVASRRRRSSPGTPFAAALVAVIVASFTLSVLQTQSDPRWAYVSPLTRAWELALGALLAVLSPRLLGASRAVARTASWAGLGAIAFSAVVFDVGATDYPGWRVAIPVLGAALVIAGGTANAGRGAEVVLGSRSFRWVGQRSYSLYLWHWPVLILADGVTASASLWKARLPAFAIAVVLSALSFRWVETPIRRHSAPDRRTVLVALASSGCVLVAATIVITLTSG